MPTIEDRLLSRRQIVEITSLSSATLHRRIAAGNFPKPVKISENRVAWTASSVNAWLASKIAEAA